MTTCPFTAKPTTGERYHAPPVQAKTRVVPEDLLVHYLSHKENTEEESSPKPTKQFSEPLDGCGIFQGTLRNLIKHPLVNVWIHVQNFVAKCSIIQRALPETWFRAHACCWAGIKLE